LVSQDRVEKAAQEYLRALISTSPASMVVRAILLGDSGNFTSAELKEISRGSPSKKRAALPGSRKGRSLTVSLPKKTRKVSKYQKRFGINLKKLKKSHPRTNISVLMKRAHRMTRKNMK